VRNFILTRKLSGRYFGARLHFLRFRKFILYIRRKKGFYSAIGAELEGKGLGGEGGGFYFGDGFTLNFSLVLVFFGGGT